MGHGAINNRRIEQMAEAHLLPGSVHAAMSGAEGAALKNFLKPGDYFFQLHFTGHPAFFFSMPCKDEA